MKNNEYTLNNGKTVTLRLERPEDYREVEVLTRAAFMKVENIKSPEDIGCDEHYLAHTLRTAPEFLPELDFIAVHDGRIVGNVMYARSYVLTPDGERHPTIIFGPLSVLPEYQSQGVGGALMRHSLREAAHMGHGAVIIYGHPEYYPRFGFKEAKEFGITTEKGENFPAFMAIELIYGALDGVTGTYHMPSVYDVDKEKAKEYDKQFQSGDEKLIH